MAVEDEALRECPGRLEGFRKEGVLGGEFGDAVAGDADGGVRLGDEGADPGG